MREIIRYQNVNGDENTPGRLFLVLGDYPDGMNDTGDAAKKCQHDIDPEMFAESDLQKSCDRRKDDCTNDFHKLHIYLAGKSYRGPYIGIN